MEYFLAYSVMLYKESPVYKVDILPLKIQRNFKTGQFILTHFKTKKRAFLFKQKRTFFENCTYVGFQTFISVP